MSVPFSARKKNCAGMTISGESVSLRESDALHLGDMRIVQQHTFEIMTKCSEIERLMVSGSPSVRDLIDSSVRKAVETQQVLDRYRSFFGDSAVRNDPKHRRLFENFERANKKLEEVIRKYREGNLRTYNDPTSTQMNVVSRSTPSRSLDLLSSMEEGHQTMHDLSRISKEMTNLQDIYVSLNDSAVNQQSSIIDTVQSRVASVADTARHTVEELSRAKNRMDYWTRLKLYTVTGITAVGIFFWLV